MRRRSTRQRFYQSSSLKSSKAKWNWRCWLVRSPPEGSRTPCAVPTPGGIGLHLSRHVLVLRYLLLNSQLLILLILLLPADVGDTCLFIFINVKDSFSWHIRPLYLVRWQGSIDLLLLWRLRRARAKASSGEQ